MKAQRIVVLAAISEDGFIGREGQLPWRLPADLRAFKARTMGQALIMGRKTFESIGRALPGRQTVVLSRSQPSLPEGVRLAGSLAEALEGLSEFEEVFIAGGEAVYAEGLPLADALELTRVHTHLVDADARFPTWNEADWERVRDERRAADEKNAFDLTFERWERRAPR